MPAFPEVLPPIGQTQEITLANGSKFLATWDGLQWWMGVNDDPNDVPVTNEYVTHWGPPAQN